MRTLLPFLACVVALPLSSQSVTSLGSLGPAVELDLAPGRVWLVPQGGGSPVPQPTIQAGVDAASEGDTVLLSDGVFRGPGNRDVRVSGKNLTIRSVNGASRTILDCEYEGRGIIYEGMEITNEGILRGVTLFRGDAENDPSYPGFGGGLLVMSGAPLIEQCTIVACRASVSGGGASFLVPASSLQPTMRDCVVIGNRSSKNGGGLSSGNGVVERCVIQGNEAANGRGGGVYAASHSGVIRDCLIARNSGLAGGGLVADGFQTITGCTIVDNETTGGYPGGVLLDSASSVVVSSTIVWGNRDNAGNIYQVAQGLSWGRGSFLRYCDIQGGPGAVYSPLPEIAPILLAISDDDPAFEAPQTGDYRLSSRSPCIDAGLPDYSAVPNEGDLELQPRVNQRIDIGADEHWPGLALSLVQPGHAGVLNRIETSGGRTGALVLFFAGLDAGLTSLSFGACPSLELSLEEPQLLGVDVADGSGQARIARLVPASLSGTSLVYQAVSFDPFVPAAGCETTGVVRFLYP